MKHAGVGEQADLVGVHHVNHIRALRLHGLRVAVVGGFIQKLAVAEAVHDEVNLLLLPRRLLVDRLAAVLQNRAPRNGELLLNGLQIFFNHLVHVFSSGQNLLVFFYLFKSLLIFLLQRQDLQADQLVEAHLQDGLGLLLCEAQLFRVGLEVWIRKLDV